MTAAIAAGAVPRNIPRNARAGRFRQQPVETAAPQAATVAIPNPSTIVALKILSCVLRVQQKLGREKVAKILAGSEDSSVKDYRSLSTYGLLSNYSIKIRNRHDRLPDRRKLHRSGNRLSPIDLRDAEGRGLLEGKAGDRNSGSQPPSVIISIFLWSRGLVAARADLLPSLVGIAISPPGPDSADTLPQVFVRGARPEQCLSDRIRIRQTDK